MSSPVFETITSLRAALRERTGIGFVPTMGALHAGHARLIERARELSETVVVSIFVNPIQFDSREDYERYGRMLEADLELCGRAGADLVFAPTVEEMYPEPLATTVDVSHVTEHFCGAARPGHFRGVTTVVAKLFHIVGPARAYFGEKDAQQLAAIERMVRDLDFPIEIVAVETMREPDGLAMSSRNARLSAPERELAARLYAALAAVRDRIAAGERDALELAAHGRGLLKQPGIVVDYFGLADARAITPLDRVTGPARAMGAIWVGQTRLIDNVLCIPPRAD